MLLMVRKSINFNVSDHGDWFRESGWSLGHSHCSENICGRMIPTNWLQIKDQWKHLRDIPKLGRSYWFRLLQPAVS